MSRLVDLIGTPTNMLTSCTSDGVTSDSSSTMPVLNIEGLAGVLFLCLHGATIGESTTASITIAYSTTGLGSDATVDTDIWMSSNAAVTFTTALGLAAGSIRSIYLDLDSKNMTSAGYLHVWAAAGETALFTSLQVIAIPWPATARLPIYAPTVEAT